MVSNELDVCLSLLLFPPPPQLTRLSTVSTMSRLLTSPTWIRPTNTANFIWIFLIGTAGLITPAGRTIEPAADTILSPVVAVAVVVTAAAAAEEPAPAATCGCCAEEPGGGGGGGGGGCGGGCCGWESRSVSVSEEAEPVGAATGFSLDISPSETGRRRRGAVAAVSHTCSTSCVRCRTKTIHRADGEGKNNKNKIK